MVSSFVIAEGEQRTPEGYESRLSPLGRFFGFPTSYVGRRWADARLQEHFLKEEAMKWMLFVLVFGSHPVETNLLFDSIDACLKAEETMRTEYARAYSQGTWGAAVGEANDPSVVSRYGQRTTATCIPHA